MKIVLNEITKNGELTKNDGTIISTYSFKNIINDEFTLEDLKKDINGFNETLAQYNDFDNIAELTPILNVHNF